MLRQSFEWFMFVQFAQAGTGGKKSCFLIEIDKN